MYPIDATFKKFNEVKLIDVMAEKGVYVFWGVGKKHPLYIGEGYLMERLEEGTFRSSWTNGYVTVLNSPYPSKNKRDGEIVEYAFLTHSKEIGCFPTFNKMHGKRKVVKDILKKHDKIRINVRHRNPLKPPSSKNKLSGTIRIYITP